MYKLIFVNVLCSFQNISKSSWTRRKNRKKQFRTANMYFFTYLHSHPKRGNWNHGRRSLITACLRTCPLLLLKNKRENLWVCVCVRVSMCVCVWWGGSILTHSFKAPSPSIFWNFTVSISGVLINPGILKPSGTVSLSHSMT